MIHPPDVIRKHAPDAVLGVVGTGTHAGAVGGAAKGDKSVAPAQRTRVANSRTVMLEGRRTGPATGVLRQWTLPWCAPHQCQGLFQHHHGVHHEQGDVDTPVGLTPLLV